jgi:hypothetical protein
VKKSRRDRTHVAQRSDRLWLSNVRSVTVTELAGVATTPAEGYAIDREGDDVVELCNDRLHAHAHEACDWRWNALVDRSTEPETISTRIGLAAHEKGAICVNKGTATIATSDQLVFGAPPEYREKEERLRPVGMIIRQRLRHAIAAALAGEQPQRLLYERWGAVEEFAQLVAPRELLGLHLHEHAHQQLGWERVH